MRKEKLILLLCFLFYTINSQAQSIKIAGKVKTDDNIIIQQATISLRTFQDSVLVSGTVTDEQGNFEFGNLKAGIYRLDVSHIGYELYHRKLELLDKDLILSEVNISKDKSFSLAAVNIKSRKPLITRSIDKLTLNIQGSVYEKGENGLRLFNVIPGVQVTGRDIQFRGSESVTVYVDNRRVLLPADQLLAYLRAIPSESIQSYELKEVPGAEYDAQGGGVIVNVVLKSDYKYGLSGNINTGYWYNDYHNAMGGGSANYRAGNLTVQGGVNYRNSPAFYEDHIAQEFKATGVYNTQTERYVEKFNSIDYNIGFDYRLNPKQTLGANYNKSSNPGDFSNSTITNSNFFTGKNVGQLDSSQHTAKNSRFLYSTQIANAFYRYKLDSLGSKFDLGYSYVNYNLEDPSSIETKFFNNAGIESRDPDSLFTHNKGKSDVHVFNIDWEQHFSTSLQLNLGAKYNRSKTDYSMDYREGLEANSPLNVSRSDRFLYRENILAFYGTIAKSFKNWELKIGLRTEQTDYTGKSFTSSEMIGRNRWDFFPSAYLSRKLGDLHSLTFSYARSIERPGFRQLNPFTFYTSLNSIQEGNPNLLPYFSNKAQLRYVFKNNYTLTVGYQNTDDEIATNITNVGDVVISRDENISDNHNYFMSVNVPIQITPWWEFNINATLRNTTLNVKTTPIVHRSRFSQNLWASSKFNLPGKYFIEVSGIYNRNRFFDIYDALNVGKVDISAKKSFFKERLTATIELSDPFHLYKPGSKINNEFLSRTVIRNKLDFARSIGFWLTYSFSGGKKSTDREGVEFGGDDARGRL
ncbi:outer membrane beta-barrel family protein [Pedobacter antarcticus]|uniref:outer membrane beta-barrel family protein n=1 Tax=Pedobacter antarcticus TaxID=34086 RepID=UPI0029317E29|nr:outer membrane beta-barrel family protein [Pedobacter antarcticus]